MISALPWLLVAGMATPTGAAAPTWAPAPSGRPRLRLGTRPLRCADPDKKRRRKAQQHARRQQRGRR